MNSARKTNLYKEIAKDFQPKQANMRICQYIEGMEKRISVLEQRAAALEGQAAKAVKPAKAKEEPVKPDAEVKNN